MFTGIHICGNSVAFGGGCLVERAVEDTVCILEMTTLWLCNPTRIRDDDGGLCRSILVQRRQAHGGRQGD